jgi:acetolactate synthase-1/3 small subunit
MIARIACDPVNRGEVGDTAGLFGAKMIDLAPNSITFEIAGTPEHLASFLDHMKPYGIVDLVKSGRVAMKKISDVARMAVGQA